MRSIARVFAFAVIASSFAFAGCCGSKCIKEPPCKPKCNPCPCGCGAPSPCGAPARPPAPMPPPPPPPPTQPK